MVAACSPFTMSACAKGQADPGADRGSGRPTGPNLVSSRRTPISGKVTIGRDGAVELEPESGRAETLERAAVWRAVHGVDRLGAHFDGRPNRWVESLRLK